MLKAAAQFELYDASYIGGEGLEEAHAYAEDMHANGTEQEAA